MRQTLANPFYYLDNFQQVLAWVGEHHDDLLVEHERRFIADFPSLPRAARALLVRMVMRKGTLFRASRLRYAEIGCPREAVAALVAAGWVEDGPALTLTDLFELLTKPELAHVFAGATSLRKAELLARLAATAGAPRPLAQWCATLDDAVFRLGIDALCERLRLLFFGNLRQDWSTFVLADLGLHRYERVAFSPTARAFQHRRDLDDYLHLQRCRERFEAGEPVAAILPEVPAAPFASDWLESRRGKLLLRLGQQLEREGALDEACRLHLSNRYPGARARAIRVLERLGEHRAALTLAQRALDAPESESEAQQVPRLLLRLQRALGLPVGKRPPAAPVDTLTLVLPRPTDGTRVEWAVRAHLHTPAAPVHYVENGLLNSLFGLLCWDAIFAPLPGAFFHPFHAGPADLGRPDFASRRADLFAACLAQLDDGAYRDRIRRTWRDKHGLLSPFVAWGLLDDALLETALACIPAAHLKHGFERILCDVPANRTGLPDLIQFWPAEGRYRMIEVKGPGDRLQDNQRRWLDHATRHGLPVAVCHVRWQDEVAA